MRFRVPSLLLVLLAAFVGTALAQGDAKIAATRASEFVGKSGQVCGKIESARYAENTSGQPTFLHLGAPFPKHTFQVRIWGKNRERFTTPPESLVGFVICVSGKIVAASGRAEMEIESPSAMLME